MLNKSGLVWLQVKGGWGSESQKEGAAGSGTGLLEALVPEESFACKSLGLTQEDGAGVQIVHHTVAHSQKVGAWEIQLGPIA